MSNLKNFNDGSVKFGNNVNAKIMRKGHVILNGGKISCDNVLYVDGLKHDLLSVSQLCKDGHKVTFSEKGCIIRSVETGKLIGTGKRNSYNLYVLSEQSSNVCKPAKHHAKDVVKRLRTLLGVVPSH